MMQVSGLSPTQINRTAAASDKSAGADQRPALEKAAKAFEAVYVRQLLGAMRKASLGADIAGSSAVDQFRELSDAKLAEGMADKGGLGIAQLLLSQLERK